jgi:sodium transport system permease protein
MISRHRITRVYVKELVDILRDRRTLVAMVVVPLVLYPLLMLGSAQALSTSVAELEQRPFVVGVLDERHAHFLQRVELEDREFQRQNETESERSPSDVTTQGQQATGEPDGSMMVFRRAQDEEHLEAAIRNREIQVGVIVTPVEATDAITKRWEVKLHYDPEELKSRYAHDWLRDLLNRFAERETERRVGLFGVPVESLHPITIENEKITTHGSVLGQILPVILVLMTITGAIYPAIDLTAGERERGTLETLMVCPVPVIELIVGKFLVVTTVAIVGAALNLFSISATVYLGGFHEALGVETSGEGFPLATLPFILLLLVPFAILCSAIMIAVASYARTFKEAQNYVTPVILATLIPGGVAALPTSELEGGLLVMPVANMVLLTRELLLGSLVPWSSIAWVLVSTTLYAVAAVGLAARIYGSESVVFCDTGSLRAAFSRRLIQPVPRPSAAMAALVMAILFPIWFFVQVNVQPAADESYARAFRNTALAMPICLVIAPTLVLWYWKVRVRTTFALAVPRLWHLLAGVLVGAALWVPAHELSVLQIRVMGIPKLLQAMDRAFHDALAGMHPLEIVLLVGIVPGICEELLFRGFLLSGLRTTFRKWTCIVASACVFAVFHFFFFRFPVTAGMGVVLGYLCWQSRSVWPAVIAHVMQNSIAMLVAVLPGWSSALRIDPTDPWAHLPGPVIVVGFVVVIAGLALARRERRE